MFRNTKVLSISLQPELMVLLDKVTRQTAKTRSEVIRDLLVAYSRENSWEKIFAWGRKTKEKFNIRSEADILKIIND